MKSASQIVSGHSPRTASFHLTSGVCTAEPGDDLSRCSGWLTPRVSIERNCTRHKGGPPSLIRAAAVKYRLGYLKSSCAAHRHRRLLGRLKNQTERASSAGVSAKRIQKLRFKINNRHRWSMSNGMTDLRKDDQAHLRYIAERPYS